MCMINQTKFKLSFYDDIRKFKTSIYKVILFFFQILNMGTSELKEDFNPWAVSSIFDFNYFCCPECECKSHSKQDFVDHISAYHTWVRFFSSILWNYFILENYGI